MHTSTIGVRENLFTRYVLDRKIEQVDSCFGKINVKTSFGYGVEKRKFEYEDLKRIAQENNLSIAQVKKELEK